MRRAYVILGLASVGVLAGRIDGNRAGVCVNGLFQETTRLFLDTHAEVYLATVSGAVLAGALIAALLAREVARAIVRPSTAARRVLRRLDVLVVPLILLAAIVVIERFRLLA